MVHYQRRRVNWLRAAIMLAAAVCFGVLGYVAGGGAALTLWLLAAIALISLLTTATIDVRVTDDAIEVTQGVWSTSDRIALDGIASASVVDIPFSRRFTRALVLDGQEVITAGDDHGVELRLVRPKRSRFFRAMVDRLVIGSDTPAALEEAIARARASVT
jgi:hypothetical protein